MNFVSIRLITDDLERLVRFYELITGLPATRYPEDFAELRTPTCTLAMGSTRTLQVFGGDIARPADNHTAIIEFRVEDVDVSFRDLADVIGGACVQRPTTMPWGNRSLLFRDPEGTLVNFFTPVREGGGRQGWDGAGRAAGGTLTGAVPPRISGTARGTRWA